jgi:8-oxo-dGTP pyrophosphatase MutT (NUDIX family)
VKLDFDQIAARLARRRVRDPRRLLSDRRAAVAAVLRLVQAEPEVLLMLRAEHKRDRWSGHVSLPGGREAKADANLRETAIRETREEVGLALDGAPLLGRLPPVRAVARGRILPMTISPFVFGLDGDEPALTLGREARAAFWLPLGRAAAGELDDKFVWRMGPVPMTFPCWRWQGQVVWGLTYQMLRGLLVELGR